TDKLVSDVQREVDELNVPFLAAVSAGRKRQIKDIATVSDGRAYVGQQAIVMGLIDGIASLDDVVASLSAGGAGGRPGFTRSVMSKPADPHARAKAEWAQMSGEQRDAW